MYSICGDRVNNEQKQGYNKKGVCNSYKIAITTMPPTRQYTQ